MGEPVEDATDAARAGEPPHPTATPSRQRWRRHLVRLVSVVIVAALVAVIVGQWHKLPRRALHPDWLLVGLSFLVLRVAALGACLRWMAVVRDLGGALSVPSAFVIHTLAMLGRYVPGKVAMVAARVHLSRRCGLGLKVAGLSALYDMVLQVVAACLVAAVALCVSPELLPSRWRWVSLAFAAGGLLALHPRAVRRFGAVAARLRGRRTAVEGLGFRALLRLAGIYVVVLAVAGVGFYLFVSAFTAVPVSHIGQFIGVLALAQIIGLLSLLVPGGLGVREGILAALLCFYMAPPLAAGLAIALRVNLSVGEAAYVIVALLLRKRLAGPHGVTPAAPRKPVTALRAPRRPLFDDGPWRSDR